MCPYKNGAPASSVIHIIQKIINTVDIFHNVRKIIGAEAFFVPGFWWFFDDFDDFFDEKIGLYNTRKHKIVYILYLKSTT